MTFNRFRCLDYPLLIMSVEFFEAVMWNFAIIVRHLFSCNESRAFTGYLGVGEFAWYNEGLGGPAAVQVSLFSVNMIGFKLSKSLHSIFIPLRSDFEPNL